MQTVKSFPAFIFAFSLLIICSCSEETARKTSPEPAATVDTTTLVAHFQNKVTQKVKAETLDYDKEGLGGGVDGFLLRKSFPGFVPQDFRGVVADGGEYIISGDTLYYSGNAASNSPVIHASGMKTLMMNTGQRLGIPIKSSSDIDLLLRSID